MLPFIPAGRRHSCLLDTDKRVREHAVKTEGIFAEAWRQIADDLCSAEHCEKEHANYVVFQNTSGRQWYENGDLLCESMCRRERNVTLYHSSVDRTAHKRSDHRTTRGCRAFQ